MRVLLLHNPTAGNGDTPKETLVRLFEDAGHAVDYRSTKGDSLDAAAAREADVVVAAGGDGTVGRVVRAIGGAARRLAVVPLGTANNIANALGLMAPPEAVARGLGAARARQVDVGVAEGPWGRRRFLEAVGVGLIAELIAEADARGVDGAERERFDREAPQTLLERNPPRRWRAVLDGEALGDELVLMEVLNIPMAGPGLRLVGLERSGDGCLDVAFLRPERRQRFAAWLDTDRRDAPKAVEVARGRQVTFEWSGGALRIDDALPEAPEEPARVVVRLEAEPLRVLVPPAADRTEDTTGRATR